MSLIKKIVGQSLTYSFAATIALTTAMGLVGVDRTANAEVPSRDAREFPAAERCSTHGSSSVQATWVTPDSPAAPSGAAPDSASSRCWSAWRR